MTFFFPPLWIWQRHLLLCLWLLRCQTVGQSKQGYTMADCSSSAVKYSLWSLFISVLLRMQTEECCWHSAFVITLVLHSNIHDIYFKTLCVVFRQWTVFLFLLKPSCLSIRIVVMDELHACPPIKMNASSQITYKFMNARQGFRQDLGTICGSFPAPAWLILNVNLLGLEL